jgi:putative ABC transport system permease protein
MGATARLQGRRHGLYYSIERIMHVWSLIGKELRYRKTGSALGLASVVVAIGSFVGAYTLLQSHDIRTDEILAERERETRVEMDRLENDYRRIMRELGHNVMILHRDQSRARLRSLGHPDTYMPEEYVHKLANGGIETLNHLHPVLQERITWPEYGLDIILTGTPGQVPVYHMVQFLTPDRTAYRNPIIEAVPERALVLGNAVARHLNVKPGDSVTLRGDTFAVHKINPPQGSQDDIMVWASLARVQQWLGKEGKINAIFALECICDIDGLGAIAKEIGGILPDVQVLEFSSLVIARGMARNRAEQEARRAIAAEIQHRAEMGAEKRAFAGVLVPLVLLASGLWVFFLVLGNVRERETEIGILRAIGVRESTIMGVFLGKAVLIGLCGAVLGYVGGVIVGATWGGISLFSADLVGMFHPLLFLVALLIATALCALASWIPAIKAAKSDPADVLRRE